MNFSTVFAGIAPDLEWALFLSNLGFIALGFFFGVLTCRISVWGKNHDTSVTRQGLDEILSEDPESNDRNSFAHIA